MKIINGIKITQALENEIRNNFQSSVDGAYLFTVKGSNGKAAAAKVEKIAKWAEQNRGYCKVIEDEYKRNKGKGIIKNQRIEVKISHPIHLVIETILEGSN